MSELIIRKLYSIIKKFPILNTLKLLIKTLLNIIIIVDLYTLHNSYILG